MSESCIACGEKLVRIGSVDGYIEGQRYDIGSCQVCGTCESIPHTSDANVYEWIYKHRSVAPGYSRYAQFADEVLKVSQPLDYLSREEDMYYGVAKTIRASVPKHGRILDVGCGLGYLTYALNRAGFHTTGLDISQEAVANAKKAYGDFFVCQDFFELEGEYDAICMLELIEHVEEPKAFIAKARTLLKEGGKLIVTTPNRSWFPEGDLWSTDLPPVHITWFTEKGIKSLFSSHFKDVILFDYTWYNLIYGRILKPILSVGMRSAVFSKDGRLLTFPYTKSSLRKRAESFGVYGFLKKGTGTFHKMRQILIGITNPHRLSLKRSATICLVARA
jgi:SAM-dependent methyltransferase